MSAGKITYFALSIVVLIFGTHFTYATNYYFHNTKGNNQNSGTSTDNPFRDLSHLTLLKFKAGDSILLASGQTFHGSIELQNTSGEPDSPIVISSYHTTDQQERATIDAEGYKNGIYLENCAHIQIHDLIITANAGAFPELENMKNPMRCGVLVKATSEGNYKNIQLSNLWIKDIFFEEKGFKRGKDEVRTANGSQSYGWGIRFINQTNGAYLKDILVENCTVENVAHTGIKFTSSHVGISNIKLLNNKVIRTGGPGIQMSRVKDGLVKGNVVNYSGSNDDSRKWGRGSGLWTWGSSDIIIEKNYFLNANGPGDSAGCHIDFNCKNVVVQYNFSANNAGGFCEILGNNYNCAYRYNISVNDGHRVKGENGAFQEGKIFWLSGFNGKGKKRTGPFNSYFYNNTIFVSKDIVAKIAVDKASSGVLIANNIFCIEGESKAVLGDQYKPEIEGVSQVKHIVFKNNLYLHESNWPKEVLIQDEGKIYGDPDFFNTGGLEISDYLPKNQTLVKDAGIEIMKIPQDSIGLAIGLNSEFDILGNKIIGNPDLGAIEIE
jgi:hypothetical protein